MLNKNFDVFTSAFIHVLSVVRHFVTECACSKRVAMKQGVVSLTATSAVFSNQKQVP